MFLWSYTLLSNVLQNFISAAVDANDNIFVVTGNLEAKIRCSRLLDLNAKGKLKR